MLSEKAHLEEEPENEQVNNSINQMNNNPNININNYQGFNIFLQYGFTQDEVRGLRMIYHLSALRNSIANGRNLDLSLNAMYQRENNWLRNNANINQNENQNNNYNNNRNGNVVRIRLNNNGFRRIRYHRRYFYEPNISFLQGFILTVGFNFGTMDHGQNINKKIGGDEMSIIFMLMSLISCFIGPIFGSIYDKLGFKKTMIILNILSVLNGSLIFVTVRLGVILYGISIILNGCLNSGAFSMIFPYVSKIFGFNYAGELYGIVVLSVGISSIMSSSIYYIISKVIKTENDLSYLFIFIVGIIMNIISIVMTFYEKEEVFSFYRVNFLQEKGFLDEKEKYKKDNSINDINESDNEDGENIYELEDKTNTNDNSENEG